MTTLLAVTTLDSQEAAQRLGRTLVERGLAACVQISTMQSLYRWNDTVQDEPEYRLVMKTTADRYVALERAIVELHGYDVPAIFALELDRVYEPFADWVAASTKRA